MESGIGVARRGGAAPLSTHPRVMAHYLLMIGCERTGERLCSRVASFVTGMMNSSLFPSMACFVPNIRWAYSALCLASLSALPSATADAQCRTPRPIWDSTIAIYRSADVRNGPDPFRAVANGGSIVASEMPRFGADATKQRELLRLTPLNTGLAADDRRIVLPQGHGAAQYPVLVSLEAGGLAALWGERGAGQSGDTSDSGQAQVTRLFSAVLSGKQWGPVQELARADGFRWNSTSISKTLEAGKGVVHLAVAGYHRFQPGFVLLLTLEKGEWRKREISLRSEAAYVDLDVSGPEMLLGYVAPVVGDGRDVNSLWLMRSSDSGRSWSPPQLIRRSGALPARDLRVFGGPSGETTLIWRQASAKLQPEAFWVMRSSRTSARWSAPTRWQPPSAAGRLLDALVAPNGDIDLIIAMGNRDALAIARSCVSGRWRVGALGPDSLHLADGATVVRFAKGERHILWSAIQVRGSVPERMWLRTPFH